MKKEIYFAGGCFWGVEKFFSRLPGVLETQSGYANGSTLTPSYEDVCFYRLRMHGLQRGRHPDMTNVISNS